VASKIEGKKVSASLSARIFRRKVTSRHFALTDGWLGFSREVTAITMQSANSSAPLWGRGARLLTLALSTVLSLYGKRPLTSADPAFFVILNIHLSATSFRNETIDSKTTRHFRILRSIFVLKFTP
jgi:hypothetical protein